MHIVHSLKFLVHFECSRFQCIIPYELLIRNYSEQTLFHPKLNACPKLCTICQGITPSNSKGGLPALEARACAHKRE